MADITSAGYDDIRAYIKNNWKIIKLYDSGNNEKISLEIGVDNRIGVSWTAGSSKIIYTLLLKGSDSDISPLLPLTLAGIGIFKNGVNSALVYEIFAPQTISSTNDVLYLTLELQIPKEE